MMHRTAPSVGRRGAPMNARAAARPETRHERIRRHGWEALVEAVRASARGDSSGLTYARGRASGFFAAAMIAGPAGFFVPTSWSAELAVEIVEAIRGAWHAEGR